MAERRMFAKSIIDSDMFLDMSLSTQALYFHLAMRADDDGFVNNPKRIQRMIGASDDELKMLVAKQYIIPFESGVVVIKHWKIHNYIQKDRYHPSSCPEKALLKAGKYKAYEPMDTECIQECIQDGNIGKVRLGKVRLGKVNNILSGNTDCISEKVDNVPQLSPKCLEDFPLELEFEKENEISDDTPPPTPSKKTKINYAEAVKMTEAEYAKLVEQIGEEGTKWCIDKLNNYKLSKGKRYKEDYRAILSWVIKEYKAQSNGAKEENPNNTTFFI